jgi:hypothetical protein
LQKSAQISLLYIFISQHGFFELISSARKSFFRMNRCGKPETTAKGLKAGAAQGQVPILVRLERGYRNQGSVIPILYQECTKLRVRRLFGYVKQ